LTTSNPSSGYRSEPGEGRRIGLYLVSLEHWHAGYSHYDSGIHASVNEDFPTCGWPVTVKAQLDVTAEQLARSLRVLADEVEAGFYMHPSNDPDETCVVKYCWEPGMADNLSAAGLRP
jgi:hypothetical protein